MKERFLRFLLAILYIGLLTALLIIYVQNIAGVVERTFAIAGTMGLSVPAVIILILYIRLKNREESIQKDTAQKETAPKELTFETIEAQLHSFSLSKRETEVAWLLYRGYTNRQIAEELYIAETTVKKHVTHIYEKMQVSGRKEYKEKLRNSIAKEDDT